MSNTISDLDFSKSADGLLPAVIQDVATGKVLMVGYMNAEALEKTQDEGTVTFFSRSKQRLWTKGETSNNFLFVKEILADCDGDTILIKATPAGPTCGLSSRIPGAAPGCSSDDTKRGLFTDLRIKIPIIAANR